MKKILLVVASVITFLVLATGCCEEEVVKSKTVTSTVTQQQRKHKININKASSYELRRNLSGVGKVKSAKIISSRKEKKFDNEYDLLERCIVGEKVYDKIKGDITVDE